MPKHLPIIKVLLSFIDYLLLMFFQCRLTQYGCYSSLSNIVTVVRMRPINSPSSVDQVVPQTEDIAGSAQLDGIGQLAAVGSTTGIIHLLDVFSGRIVRNFQVQTCPVKFVSQYTF